MILLKEILNLTTFLFFTGMIGVALNRKNIIITMMSIELMLLAVNLNFLIFSQQFDDVVGQIFVLFILTIAAIESAIGLAILSLYNSTKNTITFDVLKNKNFNLIIRKRRELILIPQRISSTLTGVEPQIRKMEESERNTKILHFFLLFLLFIIVLSMIFGAFWFTATEQKIHNLVLANQELEEEIEALLEVLKNKEPQAIRPFFGPYLTSFCLVAGVVVLLGICAYVWPNSVVAVKKGISDIILNYSKAIDTSMDTYTYTTISPEGLSLDWWVTVYGGSHVEILVKESDMPEYQLLHEYINTLYRSIEVAKSLPFNPFYQINLADMATTISQVPPIL